MKRTISRRGFLTTLGAGAGLGIATGLYTWRFEPHWLEVVEQRLPVVNLPRDLVGRRLIQISDLHIGPQVDDAYLRSCLRRAADLDAAFVVTTGDFTSYAPDTLDHARSMFAHLPRGRLGTYGVLGNHDYGLNWADTALASELSILAEAAGITMLQNQVAEKSGLHLAGLGDLWADAFEPERALRDLPADAAAIALSHNPDTVDLPGWERFTGWILAGHTHGGQCKPPFLPPPLLPVQNRRSTSGAFQIAGGRSLYINRGLGHLLQVRFNVRPEITVFHLEEASRS